MDPTALVSGTARVTVDLHPSTTAAPAAAVGAALARRLLTWCPDLGGVLLAAGAPRELGGGTGVGRVRPLSGYVRVTASVPVTLLRPRPGRRLPAVVARTGGDYVALHVLGAVNGAVGADRLAAAFHPPSSAGGAWVSRSDPDHTLAEGTPVLFEVVRVRSDGGYCSLVGALDVAGTGETARALAAVPAGAYGGGGRAGASPPSAGRKRGKEGGGKSKEGKTDRKKEKKAKRGK